jgi:hypothetical protein
VELVRFKLESFELDDQGVAALFKLELARLVSCCRRSRSLRVAVFCFQERIIVPLLVARSWTAPGVLTGIDVPALFRIGTFSVNCVVV